MVFGSWCCAQRSAARISGAISSPRNCAVHYGQSRRGHMEHEKNLGSSSESSSHGHYSTGGRIFYSSSIDREAKAQRFFMMPSATDLCILIILVC